MAWESLPALARVAERAKTKRRTLEQALYRESDLQVCAANALNALRQETANAFCFTHVANEYPVHGAAAMRWVRRLKERGLRPGVADLQVWLSGGRTLHIELKRKGKYLSVLQKQLRAELINLGHTWHTVTASTPQEAGDLVEAIVRAALKADTRAAA